MANPQLDALATEVQKNTDATAGLASIVAQLVTSINDWKVGVTQAAALSNQVKANNDAIAKTVADIQASLTAK